MVDLFRPLRWSTVLGSIAALLVFSAAAAAENWPQWRGPQGNSIAPAADYPVKFSNEEGVAWKFPLPGRGSSTPAVWNDLIFVTCTIDDCDGLLAIGTDGKERWRRQLGPERAGKHRNGSGSNPSPVTDGERVVVYYKSGTVAAFNLGGEELWRQNLQEKYGKDTLWWDLGTSPVLAGDRAIIAVMQEGNSYLVALDVTNGEVLWKQAREYECAPESDQSYTTPHVLQIDGRDTIVTWGADHLTGHDVGSGELVWESGGFNPKNAGYWRVIASAGIGNGVAVIPFGRGDFVAAVRLGGSGDITESARLWEKEGRGIGADVPSPIVDGERTYVVTDAGGIQCLETKTGEEIWSAALPRSRHKFYSSPVLAGDKLYFAREDGTVFVGQVGAEKFELLAENDMGESIIAAPVPIRGGLLIRGTDHLFRIARD